MTLNQKIKRFRTRQIVVRESSTLPYVGFEKESDLPNGWRYDIKRWCSPFDLKVPTFPRLLDPSTQGLNPEEYFKSGVGDVSLGDLKIKNIVEYSINNNKQWVPILSNGVYYNYNTSFFYYSDNSIVEYIDPNENRDSRNYIELSKTPGTMTPILAASFKRDLETREIKYRDNINQVYKFTGQYSNGSELNTVSDVGRIYWSNIDINKKEFLVDNTIDGVTRLFFNKNFIENVGSVVSTYNDLFDCEYIGYSTPGAHRIEYSDDIYVYTTLYYLKRFPVLLDNFHLYIVDASSQTYQEWTRVDDWWDMVTSSISRRYFVDKDLGIVYFGSQDPNNLPVPNRDIAVTYQTTLRVEYEEQDTELTIKAYSANTNPVTQSLNQGFVTITHEDLDPYKITLTINKPPIRGLSETLYGPINIGSDHAVLTATVTSIKGTPLPNIPVSFNVIPAIGNLNGRSREGYAVTDENGRAYSIYQPPTSAEDLGHYSTIARNSTSASYPGEREVVVSTYNDLGWEGYEDQVYLFQVLKDDIILGYKTVDDFVQQMYYEEHPAWVIDATTYARWKNEVIEKYDLTDFQAEPIETGQTIYGRKVVVYQISGSDNYDATAINPITGNTGAIVPVRPLAIERDSSNFWRIIYSNGAILDCGTSEDIAGYWLVASKKLAFQASCWSNYFNSKIFSNVINARLGMPNYMLGEYVTTSGVTTPFGWKLPSDTDMVASALDAATFITINPYKGPYPIIDLVGGSGETGDIASAPFKTIGIQFSTS